MKEIPRDTQKWEDIVERAKANGKESIRDIHERYLSAKRQRAAGGIRLRGHKGGGISRATLARMAAEDLDED
jgi:hypothetical protein